MYLLISGILSSYLIWALPNNIMNYDLWRNILLAWQIQSKKKGLTCNKKVVFCFAALWSTCQSEACWKNAAYNQKRCRSLASNEEPALQKPADQMEDQTTESPGAFHLPLVCFLLRSKSVALLKLLHVSCHGIELPLKSSPEMTEMSISTQGFCVP